MFAGATEADWRRWMELEAEPEPGLVPDSPEAMSAPVETQPAQEPAVAGPLVQMAAQDKRRMCANPEALAAMRKRVAETS